MPMLYDPDIDCVTRTVSITKEQWDIIEKRVSIEYCDELDGCGKESKSGWLCTLLANHKGDHIATFERKIIYTTWPQESE